MKTLLIEFRETPSGIQIEVKSEEGGTDLENTYVYTIVQIIRDVVPQVAEHFSRGAMTVIKDVEKG